MRHDALERLVTTLDVRLNAIAVCEIGESWRLNVEALETVICHFAIRGRGFLEFRGRRIPIAAGTIVIVPPGTAKSISGDGVVIHEISAPDSCDFYQDGLLRFRARSENASLVLGCAALEASCAGSLGMFEFLPDPLVAAVGGNHLFAAGFSALLEELSEPRIGAGVVAECLMKQAIVMLLREALDGDSRLLDHLGDHRIVRAVTAMIRSPGEPHSIGSLAEIAGMSRSSFAAHFFDQYARTPGDFLQDVRMRAAGRLLATSPMPIKCLAAAVGYSSRSQFSRAFKLAMGADPTTYRARFARDIGEEQEVTADPIELDSRAACDESVPA